MKIEKKITSIDLIYIGTSFEAIVFLKASDKFKILKIFCEKKRVTAELKEAANLNNIEIRFFDNLASLENLISNCSPCIIFFIYQLDYLIPKFLTEKYKFYNIHRGSLIDNRGPTPESWSILLGEKFSETSLHIIDERVDAGLLVKAVRFSIPEGSSILDLRLMHNSNLPILINAMLNNENNNIKGTYIPRTNKGYRPWIQDKDITIDFQKDNLLSFKNKFLTQLGFKGIIVIINQKKYFINNYISYKPVDTYVGESNQNGFLLITITSKYILIYWKKMMHLLYINTKSINSIPKKNSINKNLI